MAANTDEQSLLDKLDSVTPLAQFDAFPKLPSSYKARSESRGIMTVFVIFLTFMLMLNDISEFIWGWPDYEFSIDKTKSSNLNINLDMTVAMPCGFLSIDLRDAMGDRLYLSGGVRRDGTTFDVGQATALKEHAASLSATQAVAQSRKSRGLFAWLFGGKKNGGFKPKYKHVADGSACRITGSFAVKRVTANLHITAIGHGYASYEHIDHSQMNLSHVISEFSFGPFFPEIIQPLDNSYESTDKHWIAYQYFLHVVPTTYVAPRSYPLDTAQYSVTHYTREVSHERGTPGIFFKFDLDPLAITIHQRTTTFLQLLIRVVGVIGGVFVCTGYAIKVTYRAVEVVSGTDSSVGIVAAESSGVKVGLRAKWGGGELKARNRMSGKLVPQGNGWTMEGAGSPALGAGSPYSSYAGTPVMGAFSPAIQSPYSNAPGTPLPSTPGFGPPPGTASLRSASGLGVLPPPPRTSGHASSRSFSSNYPLPSSPAPGTAGEYPVPANGYGSTPPTPGAGYAVFPPSPAPNGSGFNIPPPPMRKSPSNGSASGKKTD